MSYLDPLPNGQMSTGNVDRSKSLDPGKESSGSGSQLGPAPNFKRPTNTPDSAAFIPMNQRTSQFQQKPLLNKGTGNIFYKTRLCVKFVAGNCSNGEKCTFAHGIEDLHEPLPNWKEYVCAKGKEALDNDRRTNRGISICRKFFFEKECPYGEKCNFLHRIPYNNEMARPLPMNLSAPSIENAGPMMLEQRNDTGKTKLNKHLTGSDALLVNRKSACSQKKMCTRYAHGQSELMMPGSQRMSGVTIHSSVSTTNSQSPLNGGGPSNETAAPTIVTEANKFPNWRPPRKIVGIYGDWLDGHSLPDNN